MGAAMRLGIYALAVACGVLAALLPPASPVLLPIATGLAGWATRAPGDHRPAQGPPADPPVDLPPAKAA